MDPVTAAALISGGSGLLGGLMGQKAKAEEERKNRLMQAYQNQMQAAQGSANAQQNAFAQLMAGYKEALL